jgi:hypothetical protein
VPEEAAEKNGQQRLGGFILLLLGLLALAAAWRWTPLGDRIDWDTLTALGASVRESNDAAHFYCALLLCCRQSDHAPGDRVDCGYSVHLRSLRAAFSYSLAGCVLAATGNLRPGQSALGRETR